MVRLIVSTLVLVFSFVFAAGQAAAMPGSFADLVEEKAKTVVNISSASKPKKVAPQQRRNPFEDQFGGRKPFEGTPFEDFFGEFFFNLPPMQQAPRNALGSGVIISADGYIVTNNHVVEGADEIVVKLNDAEQTELEAELIGRDSKNDIALIKVESETALPFAPLGTSKDLRVGDWVLAIGNPFGLGGSVSSGIVSALGRNINLGPYDDFIQTDAAINPGNSGGPLFNTGGDVVGINTAILTRTGGNQGIGFAVPADTVQLIVDQLQEHGRPIRGWLGVLIQTVDESLAEALGLDDDIGALVADVIEDSPAEKARIKEGDVILSFDGTLIREMNELPRLVAQTPIDKKVPVKLMREGKKMTVYVTIAEMEEDEEVVASRDSDEEIEDERVLGMNLAVLNKKYREELGVDQDMKGLIILSVEGDSTAREAGLRRGDVVLQANRHPVTNVGVFRTMVNAVAGKTMLLLIHRGGSNRFLGVKVPE